MMSVFSLQPSCPHECHSGEHLDPQLIVEQAHSAPYGDIMFSFGGLVRLNSDLRLAISFFQLDHDLVLYIQCQ